MTPLAAATSGLLDRGTLPALALAVHGLLHAGTVPPQPEAYQQPGGGYYRPIIYLDEDGKPTTLSERRTRREAAQPGHAVADTLPLSPQVIAALAAMQPGLDPSRVLAQLDSAERRLLWSQFDQEALAARAAEEEEALAMLLLTTF